MNNNPNPVELAIPTPVEEAGWLEDNPSTDELRIVVDQNARGQIRDLSVERDSDSSVVIKGSSRSYHAKQLAQEALLKAAPEARLRNEIEVQPPRS